MAQRSEAQKQVVFDITPNFEDHLLIVVDEFTQKILFTF